MKPFNTSEISLKALALAFTLSLLTACGGGGDGEETAGNGGGGDGEGGIIGTAKIIVKSDDVKAKAKSGNSYKAKIGKNGKYKFTKLKGGSYLLRSESKTGQLYSVAYVSKGKTATSNVHPITDLIIRNWFKQNGQDIDAQFKGSGAIAKMPSLAEINKIETAIEGILAQALKQSGVKGSVNLMGNAFEVKAGDTFNTFLTNNQVIINNNQVTLIFTGDKVQTISISGKGLETDFTADKQNPTTPTELRALPSGTHEIVVVWKSSTDDRGVAGYNIYRNGSLVATTPYPVYTDKKLSQGTNYDYMVEAIDGVGKKSGKANSDAVTTLSAPDKTPPPAIANLSATANDDDVALRWDITQVNDIARFIVKRGLRGMAKSELASITANTFTDFNLNDDNYCYSITAADAAGNKSAESAEQCALINAGGTTPSVNRTITCTSYTTLQNTTIDKDTTLNAGCYKVDSDINVENPAKLTLKPGVLLQFSAGTQLEVGSGSSLYAVGTSTSPIVFTASDKTPGFWKGIEFYRSNSSSNQLDYAVIEYGERNIDTVSSPDTKTRFSIKNSIIRQASDTGLYFYDSSIKLGAFENNILTQNAFPISIPAGMLGLLGKTNYFSGNDNDQIYVRDYDVISAQTWYAQNVPYYFSAEANYEINAALTIEPATTLIFNSGGALNVNSSGSLKAIGTSSKPILFTGRDKTQGYWEGIEFYRSNSTNNQLKYVTIEYGIININTVSFPSDKARFSLENSTIRDASNVGIYIYGSSVQIDSFKSNTLTANSSPISLPSELVSKLDKQSSFTGNTVDSIHIRDADLVSAQTWKHLDAPYFLVNSAAYDINAGLTIEAGTKLIFSTNASLEISTNGYLNAIGTAASPITFTGLEKTQGYWGGIEFYRSNSTKNIMDNVIVEYGGSGSPDTSANINSVCFPSDQARFTIKNSIIRGSGGWGVYKYAELANGCNITLINNDYSNNAKGNVRNP